MEAAATPKTGVPAPGRLLRAASDERLVARLRAGDERCFEVIYDRYHQPLLSFCRHMLGTREEAEDALQQVFVAAHRQLVGDDRPLQLRAWLYAIARNRCLSVLRARRETVGLDERTEPAADGLALEAQVQQRQDLREILTDLARLPEEQRAALVLAELDDLSHEEIALALDVRREKVKALVFQARETLMGFRQAREADCAPIREQLATLRGGALRRTTLQRHVAVCPGCAAFKAEVTRQRAVLGAVLPVIPGLALKDQVLAAVATSSAGAGAAGAGAGALLGGTLGGGGGAAGVGAGAAGAGAGAAATAAASGGSGLLALAGSSGLAAKALAVVAVAATAGGGAVVAQRVTENPAPRRAPLTRPAGTAAAPTTIAAPGAPAGGRPSTAPGASGTAPGRAAKGGKAAAGRSGAGRGRPATAPASAGGPGSAAAKGAQGGARGPGSATAKGATTGRARRPAAGGSRAVPKRAVPRPAATGIRGRSGAAPVKRAPATVAPGIRPKTVVPAPRRPAAATTSPLAPAPTTVPESPRTPRKPG